MLDACKAARALGVAHKSHMMELDEGWENEEPMTPTTPKGGAAKKKGFWGKKAKRIEDDDPRPRGVDFIKEAKDYAKEEVQEGKGVIGTITPEDLQTAIQNAKKEARAEMRMKLEAGNFDFDSDAEGN